MATENKPTRQRLGTPTRSADKFVTRLPDGMREQIANQANESGRSMNSEIVLALSNHLTGKARAWVPTKGELVMLDTGGMGTIEGFEWTDGSLHVLVDELNRPGKVPIKVPVLKLQPAVIYL